MNCVNQLVANHTSHSKCISSLVIFFRTGVVLNHSLTLLDIASFLSLTHPILLSHFSLCQLNTPILLFTFLLVVLLIIRHQQINIYINSSYCKYTDSSFHLSSNFNVISTTFILYLCNS